VLGVNVDQRVLDLLPPLRVKSGVVVASTVAGAIDARDGGLAPGDVIHSINQARVTSLADLRNALDKLGTGDPVVLQLERRGELMYLAFTVE
jgi:S1-C subfamily serine protease